MRISNYIILAATIGCLSCNGSPRKVVDAPRKVKCHTATLVNQSFVSSSFAGRVVAASDLNLGFRVAGIIEDIVVKEGAMVRKGEVIALLDSRDYELQLAATQAEYDAIKAEVDRVVELYAEQSVSANDYDKATNGLRAITTKLEAHKNSLADCKLRAPIDCYLIKANFGKGEAVAAGTPIVSIISTGAPQIIVDIPADSYLKREQMANATAVVEHLNQREFKLSIRSISPKGNLNQLYRVTFDVERNKEGNYPAVGMSATVNMNFYSDTMSLVEVPLSAIAERNGSSLVWVVKDGVVSAREVLVIKTMSNGMAFVRGGISGGDMVVEAGINTLAEGDSVVSIDAPSKSNVGDLK